MKTTRHWVDQTRVNTGAEPLDLLCHVRECVRQFSSANMIEICPFRQIIDSQRLL